MKLDVDHDFELLDLGSALQIGRGACSFVLSDACVVLKTVLLGCLLRVRCAVIGKVPTVYEFELVSVYLQSRDSLLC